MTSLNLTRHARQRLDQRGMTISDLDLILGFGTEMGDGYVILNQDREYALGYLKTALKRIEKLTGKLVVVREGDVITAFHARRKQVKRALRRSGCRD